MTSMILEAEKREGKAKQLRKKGLVPGVIYGEGIETKAVQFELSKVKPIINNNLKTSTLKVQLDDKVSCCIIKKVQRDAIYGDIVHIDVQAIDEDEKVKVKVPIVFEGKGMLESKGLLLQVFLPELEISGSAEKLPKEIKIDLSKKEHGDKVIVSDVNLDKELMVQIGKDEIIAVITSKEVKAKAETEVEA